MARKKLYDSLHKYRRRLSSLSEAIMTSFDEECIHDMRTTVKECRALMRCLGKNRKDFSGSFKKLYRLSGELRDIQVLLKEAKAAQELPPALEQWLCMQLDWLKSEWASRYQHQVVSAEGRKIAQGKYKPPHSKHLNSFLFREEGRLRSLLSQQPIPDEAIHDARKTLKKMQFAMEWFNKAGVSVIDQFSLAEIKRVGRSVGAFTDCCVGISLLNTCLEELKEAPAPELLQVKDKWEKARLRHKRRIVLALHQLVS